MDTAMFAMGCFWHPDQLFSKISGVEKVTVGYAGGHTKRPTYEQVCGGDTGHAETVEVQFDPEEISYKELLGVFWEHHDPTTPNRQGPDVGSQYRSVIFYHTSEQQRLAEESKEAEAEKRGRSVVTEIVEAKEFYPAEEYHQKYYEKQGIG
jgi:peptide-methionine (S)-S-oxide reductase